MLTNKTKPVEISIKFSTYMMDKNWQSLGRIPSENLRTFLAVTRAKIILCYLKNKAQYEYIFKKNSQISIQNRNMVFRKQDISNITVNTV